MKPCSSSASDIEPDRRYSCADMRALIFDLDGTLIDTVYAHVFAWQRALNELGLAVDGWRIHRRIGMSGGLFTRAVAFRVYRDAEDLLASLDEPGIVLPARQA